MNFWCELDGARVAPPVNLDDWHLRLDRDAEARADVVPSADALVFQRQGMQLLAAASRAGAPQIHLRIGFIEGGLEHSLFEGALDLRRLRLSASTASAPVAAAGARAAFERALPRSVDLLAALRYSGELLAGHESSAPEVAWLDSPQPPEATSTTNVFRAGRALQRALAAASDSALSLSSESLSAAGPFGAVAVASGRMIRDVPGARLLLSPAELLRELSRVFALGWWLEGTNVCVEPLYVAFDRTPSFEFRVETEQVVERPSPNANYREIRYGYRVGESDTASSLPSLYVPRRAEVKDGTGTVLELQSSWVASSAIVESLRTAPYSAELFTAPTPFDHAIVLLDLIEAPHPAAGGARVLRLQRGVTRAHGLPWPELQPGWGLTPAVQLRRWAPWWGGSGRAVPAPAQVSASAEGPAHRLGVNYLLRGQAYTEPTARVGTDEPAEASGLFGTEIEATLRIEPAQAGSLLALPRACIRLVWGAAHYATGVIEHLDYQPATGRLHLRLLSFA
jgi:hypothetical protein